MNICLVSLEWPPRGCGIGTYMFNLSRGLSRFGHQVTVITHDKNPLPVAGVEIVEAAVPEERSSLRQKLKRWQLEPYHTWSSRAYRAYQRLAANKKFDVIETAEYGAWARHFVGAVDVPIVVRCHNPFHIVWSANQISTHSSRKPLWLDIQDRCERRQTFYADAIVSPSFTLADHLSLEWVIPRSRFTVIPNVIDSDFFCPSDGSVPQEKEILYVGRLQYNKGCFDLAAAAGFLLGKYDRVKIRFLGMDMKSPPEYKNYGGMSSEVIRAIIPRQFHDRLCFTHHVAISEVVGFYHRALCTVMPTRGFESFSYTVLEPMACGSAVIATRCGGPTEIIADRIDGVLIDPGDREELTRSLETVIRNESYRLSLARSARRSVEAKFSIPAVMPRITNFYEQVINNFHNKKALDSEAVRQRCHTHIQ